MTRSTQMTQTFYFYFYIYRTRFFSFFFFFLKKKYHNFSFWIKECITFAKKHTIIFLQIRLFTFINIYELKRKRGHWFIYSPIFGDKYAWSTASCVSVICTIISKLVNRNVIINFEMSHFFYRERERKRKNFIVVYFQKKKKRERNSSYVYVNPKKKRERS
jgi:hypothetical protein